MNTKGKKKTLTQLIEDKYALNPRNGFFDLATRHINVLSRYLVPYQTIGPTAFPTRKEYQAFAIAKLFVDKLEHSKFSQEVPTEDVTLEVFNVPHLENFHMTKDEKEMKRNLFLKSVAKGDVLHLLVVQIESGNYTLEVINKYNDKERIIDYSVFASMLKSHHLVESRLVFQKGDLVRGVVLGSVKQEEGRYRKILVSLNVGILPAQYKTLHLGRVTMHDIPFYPEDLSKVKSLAAYLKTKKRMLGSSKHLAKVIASMGINPYNYSTFCENDYNYKLDQTSKYEWIILRQKLAQENASKRQSEKMEKAKAVVELLEKASNSLNSGTPAIALSIVEESLTLQPKNSAALALRGKIQAAISGKDISPAVLKDFKEALKINPHNKMAKEESLELILKYSKKYSDKEIFAEAGGISQ